MRCRPEVNLDTDIPYWVPRNIFYTHFDQDDFRCRESIAVRPAYLADWFYTPEGGPTRFFLPTVQLISGKTQFINGRHRTAVLLPFLEKLPIAVACESGKAAAWVDKLGLDSFSLDCWIDLPDLPILSTLFTRPLEPTVSDDRTDREILENIDRLVRDIALKGAKTIEEVEAISRLMTEPIEALHLSQRTMDVLTGAGIKTVKALASLRASELLAIESMGRLSRNEIIEVLAENGLRLRHGEYFHVPRGVS